MSDNHYHNKLTRFALTYTGQRVYEHQGRVWPEDGAPNLTDMAVQCGRIARFVGATTIFYPVLLHHFVVYEDMAARDADPRVLLEALIHDGHEGITGDIPSPYKPPVVTDFQDELDQRIYISLGVDPCTDEELRQIKEADTRALLAEAWEIGPPGSLEWVKSIGGADPDTVEILHRVLETYPGYADVLDPRGRAVQDYINMVENLLEEVHEDG